METHSVKSVSVDSTLVDIMKDKSAVVFCTLGVPKSKGGPKVC